MAEKSPGIRVLCPTRWTVRADSLASVITNYETLQSTWEEGLTITQDTEAKARIRGISVQMRIFDFIYGCILGELILQHTDNLSSTLQHKSMSAAEGQEIARMTVDSLKSIGNHESFDIFREKVISKAKSLDVTDPQLPQQHKLRRRYDDGLSSGDFPDTPKAHYRLSYYEAFDLIINCTEGSFNQPGYCVFGGLQTLLIKACKQEELEKDLQDVSTFYKDDFDLDTLCTQLQTFGVHFQKVLTQEVHQ